MVNISFAPQDYRRGVPHQADLRLVNRYYEQNPTLTEDGVSLIARPGLRKFMDIPGAIGPGRGIYTQPGTFSDALFVAMHEKLFRIDKDRTATEITDALLPGNTNVSMAIVGSIGTTPEYLWVADGNTLWLYLENGYARGTLTFSSNAANSDQVRIGDVYYQFTTGSVDTGTPAGTSGSPWLVAVGSDAAESIGNLSGAIQANGIAGTDYSTGVTAHPLVSVYSASTNTLTVRYNEAGITGNALVTTETGANLAWGAGTLENGGDPTINQVDVPDALGATQVAVINSTVIVVPAQTGDAIGRFYWIEPGETEIDPLNFATAESAPDPLLGVVIYGDLIMFPGQNKTEVWQPTGNDAAPFQRVQGIAFDRGAWQGSAVKVKESMIIVDNDGGVFQINGGSMQRISNHSIEERIREAIRYQSLLEI